MQSIELDESTEVRCTLYEQFAYESDYLSMPSIASLSDEERRKQREQDKEEFLEWLWLSPLAGGLAGDVGLDELYRLRKFAEANRLDCGHTRHDHKKLEEAIKEAVEDDLLIPVIDRTDDWGGGYLPALDSQAVPLTDGLLRVSDTSFAPLSGVFDDGEVILSGPYDPAMQEAKLKAARSDAGGFDWLGAVEAVAGAALDETDSRDDDRDDSMLKNFGNFDGSGNMSLGDAQPFEYQAGMPGGDVFEIAKTPNLGEPDTWYTNPGSGQMRLYGSGGRPVVDLDFDHVHNGLRPHAHNWGPNGRDSGFDVVPFSPWSP